jgi:enoyl-CoA hydratase
MTYECILLEHEGPVSWLTMNRPERLNAMNDQLLAELDDALTSLQRTKSRVVVIRGAGRAFSAGYDVSADAEEIGYASERGPVANRDRLLGNIELWTRVWRHEQPIIAAVHGHCIAGGAQLATMCDITIVAEDARIQSSPSLPLGGGYLSPLWDHLVGPKRSKLMSFDAGRSISGSKAAEWGWAAEAVPAAELDDYVRDLAHSIARTPGNVLRLKKEAINRITELEGLLTYARMGAETDALLHLTPEVQMAKAWIGELGLKGAIQRFREEGLPDVEEM